MNITEYKKTEEELQSRIEFEKLISLISIDFINVQNKNINDLINKALKKIGQFVNATRCSLFIYSKNLTRITNTNEWCIVPNDSQIDLLQNIPSEQFGYYLKLLKEKKDVIINQFDDIPLEASGEREWVKEYGFRSLMFVPMLYKNKLFGTLGFYGEINVEIKWKKNLIDLLKVLANIFVNSIVRKRTEQKLKESEEKYRQAYNIADFYKNLFAHDINNILNNISSSSQLCSMLLDQPDNQDKIREFLDVINREVKRGTSLISNVRRLSEIEESEMSIETTELCGILKESIDSLITSFPRRDINVHIDVIDKKIFVKANNLLMDIFGNILDNSVKYNENPSVEIIVKISKEQKKGQNYVKLEFIDNGIGINDTQKEFVFKKGHKEHKGGKGMGFGLSLVKKIIDSYKGQVWVEDRVKGDYTQGSTFIVSIAQAITKK
ncbi:hypothetical protein LCGC14_1228870 [marine sediment metagenome]|uniref:histidine kinase n=1 Tax=marine sediment metagenome TaxID=412755 RepID=A0A0F9NRE4_9ZZZZ